MNYPIVPSNHGAHATSPSVPVDIRISSLLSQLAVLLSDLTSQLDSHFK